MGSCRTNNSGNEVLLPQVSHELFFLHHLKKNFVSAYISNTCSLLNILENKSIKKEITCYPTTHSLTTVLRDFSIHVLCGISEYKLFCNLLLYLNFLKHITFPRVFHIVWMPAWRLIEGCALFFLTNPVLLQS